MISVVIPLYNKESSINKTIHSVLNQTYKDFELIIVNDGSTDNSLTIVQSIDDSRIKIINKMNGGVSSARNTGIINATYEYIALLDGDDIWFEKHLELLVTSINQFKPINNIGGFGTAFYKSDSRIFDLTKFNLTDPMIVDNYFQFMASPIPRFNSSTLLILKSKVIETGLFDENLKYGEDVEFWYKLFSKYKLVYIDTITTIYFTSAENRSTHYVMPLDKRFHQFTYKDKSISEKKYLDKLLALIYIDYLNQGAYKIAFNVFKKYPFRTFGVMNYIFNLILKKINMKAS